MNVLFMLICLIYQVKAEMTVATEMAARESLYRIDGFSAVHTTADATYSCQKNCRKDQEKS